MYFSYKVCQVLLHLRMSKTSPSVCITASITASNPHPGFPEAGNQSLICAKPRTLNPSQTLNNAPGVGPHRGHVTHLSPDHSSVSARGIFSSPIVLFILFHFFLTTDSQLGSLFDLSHSSTLQLGEGLSISHA